MKKKFLSLLLVAAMAVMAVGCGSGSSTSSTDSSAGSSAGSNEQAAAPAESAGSDEQAAPAEEASDIEKPDSITIMVDGTVFTQENGQEQFIAKIEELTGISDIKVIQPDHDAYYDVLGQTIASGDWPDVLIASSTYYSAYAAEGVLWDMTDMWEGSDLQARQKAYNADGVVEGMKIDGRLYGMPAARGNGCMTYVKKAWLDAVGMDVPTNFDEYYAMLQAFTTQDPDGDGKNDTYGVSAAGFVGGEAPYINYLAEFYQDAYPSFYQKDDGTWADGFTEDSMKGAMERLATAYSDGVIDPTTLTNGTSDCRNKFYADEFGVFTYWAGTWATNLKTNLDANGIDSELIALPPLAEVGKYLDRIPPVWCITTKCANPEGVYKYFIETMQDGGETQFAWTYGVEGTHWSTAAETLWEGAENETTYAEGEFHMLPNLEKPETAYTKAHIDPMLALTDLTAYPAGVTENPMDKAVAEEAKNSANVFAENCVSAVLVPSTDVLTQLNGDLTALKNQLIADVTMGKITVDEAYAQFESDGGADWSKQIVDSLNAQ